MRENLKILAIDINPETSINAPGVLLSKFFDGLKEGGALVEYHNTSNMHIELCKGCTENLEYSTSGNCRCNDDLTPIIPSFRDADVWLFAYNCCNGSVSSKFNLILDRLEPLFQPSFDIMQYNNPNFFNKNGNSGKVLLFSTSNHWDISAFDMIVNQLKSLSILFSREFLTPMLRPHYDAIYALENMNINCLDIQNAAFNAGYELAKIGSISSENTKIFSREMVSKDSFINEVLHCFAK